MTSEETPMVSYPVTEADFLRLVLELERVVAPALDRLVPITDLVVLQGSGVYQNARGGSSIVPTDWFSHPE